MRRQKSGDRLDELIRQGLTEHVLDEWKDVLEAPGNDEVCHRTFAQVQAAMPKRNRSLRTVAAIFAVGFMLFACSMFFPEARAFLFGTQMEWQEQSVKISGTTTVVENRPALKRWALKIIPRGWKNVSYGETWYHGWYFYENGNGKKLSFNFEFIGDGFSGTYDTAYARPSIMEFQGREAYCFESLSEDGWNTFIWFNEDYSYKFCISGELEMEKLIKMAENAVRAEA